MARSFSILGDSISTFEGMMPTENRWYFDSSDANSTGISNPAETWWMQTIDMLDGKLLSNASFSGSMVQGAGFPAACDMRRARQLLGPSGEQPDRILSFMGINDYGWGSPEAQAKGGSEAAPKPDTKPDRLPIQGSMSSVDPAGPAPNDAPKRFESAYAQMLANIKEVAPDAEIWCMTLPPGRLFSSDGSTFCYRLRGIDISEYNNAIRSAANAMGARVADVAGIGFDYETADGTHPTRDGMAQLAMLACAAILAEEGDRSAASAIMARYPERLRSQRLCDKPTCIGCGLSSIEPGRWSCVCDARLGD